MSQAIGVTVSFTESLGFQIIGNFLQTICSPYPIPIIRQLGNTAPGVNNRVPEPIAGDFIIMSSVYNPRLAYNITSYVDNIIVGSISGTTLTVTQVIKGSVPIGALIFDGNNPPQIAPNTVILSQLSGNPNGTGTYSVSVSQTLNSQNLYPGVRTDIAPSQWVVQLDIHGPNSMQNVRTIDSLFRSDYATQFFASQNFPGAPLYAGEPMQIPFENAEQQMEYRWVMELNMDVYIAIGTPQQFADQIVVTPIEVSPQSIT